jgi:hypothetical protein
MAGGRPWQPGWRRDEDGEEEEEAQEIDFFSFSERLVVLNHDILVPYGF